MKSITRRLLLLLVAIPPSIIAQPLPNPSQSRCGTDASLGELPFCNASLAWNTRVADLVARLSMDEKIAMMHDAVAVERLGVPALPWGEALHGVVSHCYGTTCPTSFPHALALAAAFNRTLWRAVGDAISTEARALNNLGAADYIGKGPYAPLMMWAPNLNPFRDPRWGRGHETPGEDPFVCAEYGVEFVTGLQGSVPSSTTTHFMKAVAIVKHSFDYDLEGNNGPAERTAFNAIVSAVDQSNYFWPPFRAVVSRAQAGGLMCSYNGVNGIPSCMNSEWNNGVVRETWGLSNGIIVSDCGAIADTFSSSYISEHYGGSPDAQVAQALRGGCDFNCGDFYAEHLGAALENGAVLGSDVDRSVSRVLRKAFELGLFDAPAS